MQRISLEIYTTAYEAIKILESVADHKVELELPAGSVLLDNILNLKLIAEGAKKTGKSVDFVTADPFGQNLIKILRGETDQVVVRENEAVGVGGGASFGAGGAVGGAVGSGTIAVASNSLKNKGVGLKLPSISLPKFKVALNLRKLGLLLPIILLLGVGLGFLYLSRMHKAKIVLHFSAQPLTKSVTVKVGDGLKTDLDKKVLGGLKISRSLEHSLELASTGTKLEGEKAKGKVTLYNSTEEDIALKKGSQITYKKDDTSYNFFTDAEVKIPARTDSPPPDTTITKGTVEVSVTGENIGDAYNLKKERDFSVKGYKSSELVGSNSADFKGGSSKEVKIVTQADLTKLEQDLTAYILTNPSEGLTTAVPNGFNFVTKSEKITSKNVVQNNKVGEEKDKLSGSITAQVEGLAYSKTELADFMGKISQNLVPPGFEFYSYNKDITVEVLGNTETTVLSPTEADLQVTFRFFISPKIDKEKVFDSIAGLPPTEASDVLKSINGVENVELTVTPGFPLFRNVPTKSSAVEIETKIGD